MKRRFGFLACLGLLLFVNSAVAGDKASPSGELRKPGFLFLELRVSDMKAYADFLHDVLGFETVHEQPNFMTLETTIAQILLSGGIKPPPPDRKLGNGVEIGFAVADLDATFATVAKHSAWRVAAKIQKQPWGVRDFRVYAPDGYYFRITEPPK